MPTDARFARQVSAFGLGAQRRLADLTVAVVGVGGVGSLVAQSLALLGVGRLLLMDPDVVGASNLNRLVGATPSDIGTPKVAVVAHHARTSRPELAVRGMHSTVLTPSAWRSLRCADVIVGAVDTHAARWALNRLAVQYARCYVDIGVDLRRAPEGGRVEAGGHVAVVRPNGPCLLCMSGYDPVAATRELTPALTQARRAAGYRTDEPDQPTPSVVFLNQVLAGHAVAELLNWISAWRSPVPYTLAELDKGTTTTLSAERDPGCGACGPDSARALGDAATPPDFKSQ